MMTAKNDPKMKEKFGYVIKVAGKEVWHGRNPIEPYARIKQKNPGKEVAIAWRTNENNSRVGIADSDDKHFAECEMVSRESTWINKSTGRRLSKDNCVSSIHEDVPAIFGRADGLDLFDADPRNCTAISGYPLCCDTNAYFIFGGRLVLRWNKK